MNLEKKLSHEKSKLRNFILSSLAAILFSSCSSPISKSKDDYQNPTNPLTPPTTEDASDYDYTTKIRNIASQNINSAGGLIEVVDANSYLSGAKLIIPSGALSSNTEISVGEVDNPPELPYGFNYIGSAISFEPDGLNFNNPITIQIPYQDNFLSDAGIPDDSNLQLYCYNKSSQSWEEIIPLGVENNILTAKINHFSYYAITGLSSMPPSNSDLGIPLPGDLLYTQGMIGGNARFNYSWMPGHVGIYVGEKVFEGNSYNVIHATPTGVARSYYNPISNFSGSNMFMGAREPKTGALNSQQRRDIVNYVESQVGKPYAWEQTILAFYGMLRGSLVKGPNSFNCVGLAEKAYEVAGVNGGEGLTTYEQEDCPRENIHGFSLAALTPAEHYNSTKPASGISSPIVDPSTFPFANFSITPYTGNVNTNFYFDASISKDNETPLAGLLFRWDFDDEGTSENEDAYDTDWSSDCKIYHQYSIPKMYSVQLQVKDGDGLTNYVIKGVNVTLP